MALFPTMDPKAARKRFNDSLGAFHMNLRKETGHGKELSIVVRTSGSCYRISDEVQVDLFEFQTLRQKAMATTDPTRAIELHAEAASHVRGTLLGGGVDYPWSGRRRGIFDKDVIVNLNRMERLLSELGPSWPATEVLERILVVDPAMESVSRRLMESYAALGSPELAQREFQRLCNALAEERRKPSPATLRTYQRIRRHYGLP
jgi:DNA-binding SARP family transcriptional activator